MNEKIIKDLSVSIRQRLLNFAREARRPFDEVLQYYMIERFIYRLSKSPYKNRFILKGALMLVVWNLTDTRTTRDNDFLGITDNNVANVTNIIKEVCEIECSDDAAIFIADSVACESIQEQNEYHGIRVRFYGELAKAHIRMQIDIGFGDVVFPQPIDLQYPTLLGMPSPFILGYTPETLIAEKVHAMVRLGARNSRIKDYFDVWFLSHQFLFDGNQLSEAINQTFLKRKMSISAMEPDVFEAFGKDASKQHQWKLFIEKNQLAISPKSFSEAIQQIKIFIYPLFEFKKKEKPFQLTWHPPGPWR
jgi:hypothetical protein